MRAIVAPVVVATVSAGCGAVDSSGDGSSDGERRGAATATQSPSTPATKSPGTAENPGGRVIRTADSEFGPMLFDRVGQAIYLFAKERSGKPECYGACARAWPPVLTRGSPQARGETRSELLGTTRRTDGTTQVTYKGHPLYFYAHEDRGQVLCHNVIENGGLWLVVTPKGDPAPA